MSARSPDGMSGLEYHVLLALASGPLYGYALKGAVETESGGTQAPGAGSLYRVLARLMSWGLVDEAEAPESTAPHPGLARKYYRLTADGRRALADEARRLRSVAALAARRLGAVEDDRS
ncbi:MAG TPA: PadR family transcriptional regulator [Thermoanaerobaculia bacterium]|nr:PadR family transcriptional regulator [Thermoanaerobaculia bacterium]